jgi:PKD repeat protein
MRKILLLGFVILIFFSAQAQYNGAAIWHIGNKKLDFNTNPITITDISSPFLGIGASLALSDSIGNLLLFASYETYTIYNKNLQPLKNGDNIQNGCGPGCSIFIPKPDNDSLIYFIHYNLYSLIDVKNDTVLEKNIEWYLEKKTDAFVANIQVTFHSNSKDIWLIIEDKKDVYSYLITKNGISSTYSAFSSLSRALFKLSPTGEFFMCHDRENNGSDTIYWGKFNKTTGVFAELGSYDLGKESFLTNSFSPDETKLYYYTSDYQYAKLFQVDIANDIFEFDNHKLIFSHEHTLGVTISVISKMQIGIDGKIYHIFMLGKKINVIHNPNQSGVESNYQDNYIPLSTMYPSVPNYISTWLAPTNFSYTNSCFSEAVIFSLTTPKLPKSILWNFGDNQTSTEQNPTHTYDLSGEYTVTLKVTYYDNSEKTITKQITITEKPEKPIINY